jgi:hypothetical protein
VNVFAANLVLGMYTSPVWSPADRFYKPHFMEVADDFRNCVYNYNAQRFVHLLKAHQHMDFPRGETILHGLARTHAMTGIKLRHVDRNISNLLEFYIKKVGRNVTTLNIRKTNERNENVIYIARRQNKPLTARSLRKIYFMQEKEWMLVKQNFMENYQEQYHTFQERIFSKMRQY